MKNRLRLLIAFVLFSSVTITAQTAKVSDVKDDVKILESKDPNGWKKVGSIGLDFGLLNLINPRPGAGDNRFGFGGGVTYLANYKDTNTIWTNKFTGQLAVVSIAGGPYTKSADALQFTSQAGRRISEKWYLGGLVDFQTQILPTYGSNYLTATPKGVDAATLKTIKKTSDFLSPASFKLSPGFIYKHDAHLSVFLSPLALKGVICLDTAIANTGNFFPNPDKNKTIDLQLGAEVRLDYNNKFAADRILYFGTLDLYSNYLRDPQNIAIEFLQHLRFQNH